MMALCLYCDNFIYSGPFECGVVLCSCSWCRSSDYVTAWRRYGADSKRFQELRDAVVLDAREHESSIWCVREIPQEGKADKEQPPNDWKRGSVHFELFQIDEN